MKNLIYGIFVGAIAVFGLACPHYYEMGMYAGDYGKGYRKGVEKAYADCDSWILDEHDRALEACMDTLGNTIEYY